MPRRGDAQCDSVYKQDLSGIITAAFSKHTKQYLCKEYNCNFLSQNLWKRNKTLIALNFQLAENLLLPEIVLSITTNNGK